MRTANWEHRWMQSHLGNFSPPFPEFPNSLPSEFDQHTFLSVSVTKGAKHTHCSQGSICNKTHQAECAKIQSVAVDAYCGGVNMNCPIGH